MELSETSSAWTAFQAAADTYLPAGLAADRLPVFQQLYAHILTGNSRMNLTRITSLDAFWVQHLLDAFTLVPLLRDLPETFSLADIGSGAGFPALPLAIIFPQARITAVESVQKKARFIAETAQALGLANVSVQGERAEILGQDKHFRGNVRCCHRALGGCAECSGGIVHAAGESKRGFLRAEKRICFA